MENSLTPLLNVLSVIVPIFLFVLVCFLSTGALSFDQDQIDYNFKKQAKGWYKHNKVKVPERMKDWPD